MSKQAEPPCAEEEPMAADRTAVTERPERRSRQSMVVKPRASNGPFLVIGAIASAAAGFGLVFMTGLGRSRPLSGMPEVAGIASVPGEGTIPTQDPSDTASSPPSTPRFFSPAGSPAAAAVEEPGRNRFAAQPVALETGDEPGSPVAPSSGFSKFAAAGPTRQELPDAANGEAEGASVAETSEAKPVEESPIVPDQPEPVVADASGQTDAPPVAAATSPADAGPAAAAPEEAALKKTAIKEAIPQPAARASSGENPPEGSVSGETVSSSAEPAIPAGPPQPGLRRPPLESTLAAALAPKRPEPPKPVGPPQPASTVIDDPGAPIPVTPPGGRPQPPVAAGASPDLPPVARPRGERLASADATRGFGAAPPLVPPAEEPSPDATAPALAAAAGLGPLKPDGRPGPIQLEGIQTPQLTIEKRGPREVQVGKVARYEMAVRNVGAVSAHDVTLRDRVPLGTRLISTSPPATPGESGELVWTLGTLPQAAQARVTMEVMPVEEGEVGSVASVSFRADASVRSVATRAAIAIEVAEAKPVLVGSTVDLAITVRNPGTGEATGVVLEGTLPSGFRHAAGTELEFDVGRLRPGDSRRVDLKLASTHPGVQKLKLIARADGRIETERDVRLEVTAPTLELAVNMPNRRYLQRPVTCVLSMNNAGTAPANTIDLAAQLPPGMKFVRANNAGHYEESTHRVLWHLEQLPAAEVGSVEMVLVPTALGPQRIAAAARSSDGLTAQIDHTVEVEGLAALLFEVGDSEDPIEVDGITEYVVRVGNQGTKAATGVRVTATLLGDLEPVDAKGPSTHRVENLSIRFDPLAKLAPAGEAVYRIRVRGRREGDQRVQVQVTSDDSQAPITKEEVTRVYSDR